MHPVWPCEAESRAGDHAERNRRWAGHAIPQPQEVGGGTVHHLFVEVTNNLTDKAVTVNASSSGTITISPDGHTFTSTSTERL